MEGNNFELKKICSQLDILITQKAKLTRQFKQYLQTQQWKQTLQFSDCESPPAYKYLPYAENRFHLSISHCGNKP